MPRLSTTNYLKIHGILRELWYTYEYQAIFSILSPKQQLDLHNYFQTTSHVSDKELLAERRCLTAQDLSLPNLAGKAFAGLMPWRRPAADTTEPISGVVMNPEPDYRKLARASIAIARRRLADDERKV